MSWLPYGLINDDDNNNSIHSHSHTFIGVYYVRVYVAYNVSDNTAWIFMSRVKLCHEV